MDSWGSEDDLFREPFELELRQIRVNLAEPRADTFDMFWRRHRIVAFQHNRRGFDSNLGRP